MIAVVSCIMKSVKHDRRYNRSSDMESQMYPSVKDIEEFLARDKSKPFICCEYSHAMGNSNGAMHKYTDLGRTWSHPIRAVLSGIMLIR